MAPGAKLMAAAPELKELVRALTGPIASDETKAYARALIAKLDGEPSQQSMF